MIEVIERPTPSQRNVLGTFADMAAAKSFVEALGVAFMEDDADCPNCADALLSDGRIVALQPEGFKL